MMILKKLKALQVPLIGSYLPAYVALMVLNFGVALAEKQGPGFPNFAGEPSNAHAWEVLVDDENQLPLRMEPAPTLHQAIRNQNLLAVVSHVQNRPQDMLELDEDGDSALLAALRTHDARYVDLFLNDYSEAVDRVYVNAITFQFFVDDFLKAHNMEVLLDGEEAKQFFLIVGGFLFVRNVYGVLGHDEGSSPWVGSIVHFLANSSGGHLALELLRSAFEGPLSSFSESNRFLRNRIVAALLHSVDSDSETPRQIALEAQNQGVIHFYQQLNRDIWQILP